MTQIEFKEKGIRKKSGSWIKKLKTFLTCLFFLLNYDYKMPLLTCLIYVDMNIKNSMIFINIRKERPSD